MNSVEGVSCPLKVGDAIIAAILVQVIDNAMIFGSGRRKKSQSYKSMSQTGMQLAICGFEDRNIEVATLMDRTLAKSSGAS